MNMMPNFSSVPDLVAPLVRPVQAAWRRRVGNVMAWLHDLFGFADRRIGSVVDLVVRLWLAQIFFPSGFLKVTNWQTALTLAASEYPVNWLDPVTAAWLGAGIELICPMFIAVGLFTRAAAIPLAALSLIIQFSYKELPDHLFWAILFGWMFVRGPGALSLDRLFGKALAASALPGARIGAALIGAIETYLAPVYTLFVRLWMAEIFWSSGQTKIASWDLTVQLFQDEYKVPLLPPELAATLATGIELCAPVLLALGLCTRLAALPLIAMTLVIQFTYLDRAEHFFWIVLLALIALRGPGNLSLDALILRWLCRVFPQLAGKPAFSLQNAPRVVIVGAGFGGIAAAKALRKTPARVTVIDRRNYHLFQPLLYQVATAGLSPADIATPIREIVRDQFNTRVLLGRVTGVDPIAKNVLMDAARVPYDYLILATGARHSYFGKDEWANFAPGLKKIDDATQIRARILGAFEAAESAEAEDARRKLLTFVIVGAGPTGIELAGAIVELARLGMDKDFRSFDPASARIVLIEAGPRILATFPESLSAWAKDALTAQGVEIMTGARVEQVDADGVLINGQRIAAGTVLWGAGVMASPAAKWLGVDADRAGRIVVDADLSVPGWPNMFAIGDTASVMDARGKAVPGLAPAAKQGGQYVAALIRARIEERKVPRPFRYRHYGSLATIGRKAAIADFGRIQLKGALAWWFWGFVHVGFLVGARNRIGVMLDWFWAYVTFRRGTRLITGNED
ncbi:MAG: FAD-dependent oxidoreductase [Alphaproteobacteria bacterium]